MLPNCIIIGVRKAGTTWLNENLAEHPEAFMLLGENPFFQYPDYCVDKLKEFEALFLLSNLCNF